MDLVQKEHDRLVKRLKASQGIKNVQSTIDLLQSARDAIASGESGISHFVSGNLRRKDQPTDLVSFHTDPNQAAVTLAKLQNPVKASFDSINDSLKETHSGLNKYTKSLDKVPGHIFMVDFGTLTDPLYSLSSSKTDPSLALSTTPSPNRKISSTVR